MKKMKHRTLESSKNDKFADQSRMKTKQDFIFRKTLLPKHKSVDTLSRDIYK